jgi:hypothetical protein
MSKTVYMEQTPMSARFASYILLALLLLMVGGFVGYAIRAYQPTPLSPYVAQLDSPVRGLSAQEVDDLLNGRGAGYARTAELNSYPGPRHLLDLAEALELSQVQVEALNKLFEEMQAEAQGLGTQIVEAEESLSNAFADRAISAETLAGQSLDLAELYGQLRVVHLQAHLQSRALLTDDQVTRYNALRGYDQTASNPESQPHHNNH